MIEFRKYIIDIIMVFLGIAIANAINLIPDKNSNLHILVILSIISGIISMLILVYIIKKINEEVDTQSESKMKINLAKMESEKIVFDKAKLKKEIIKNTFINQVKSNRLTISITSLFSVLCVVFLIYSSFTKENKNLILNKSVESVLRDDTLIINELSNSRSELKNLNKKIEKVNLNMIKILKDSINNSK